MATSSGKLTCYGTNGAVETGAIACDPQAKVSTCCPYTDICYSNGLCAIGPGQPTNGGQTPYYTGFCTDRSWSNGTACPSICNNQPGGDIVGNGLQMCGGNAYCCYDLSLADCCQTSSLVFSLAAITSSTSLPSSPSSVSVTTSSFSTSTESTTTSSSSLEFSNPPSPTILTDATSTSSISLESSTSTLPTILPTNLSSTLPSTSPRGSNASTNHFAAGVGAGIGISAALLFLIGPIYIIRKRQTRNRASRTHKNPAHGEKLGITTVRIHRRIHEMEGEKPTLVEPDGQHIVEIDDTRGSSFL